jgi:metallo-beta-lactamase family protein
MMNITFWGATDEVTGSMTMVELPEGMVLIDCGMTQEDSKKPVFPPLPASELKAILITHAHLDHSGFLPALVKKGFKGGIYCTPITFELMKIILKDSAGLNDSELYDDKDVQATFKLVQTYNFNQPLSLLGASVKFLSAGHILGASSISIKSNGKKVIFSGDLGRQVDPIILPYDPCPEADMVVMESTYGAKVRTADMEKELHTFLINISRESRVGIIASFAVARAQLLTFLIYQFFQRHPAEKIRVVMDGPMMKEAHRVYKKHAHLTKVPEALFEALEDIESIDYPRMWDSLKKKEGPLIIISSSGMLTGGRVWRHLQNWQNDPKAVLFLPGYQGEGTPGRSLVEGHRTLTDKNGLTVNWSGEVWNSDAFSSHADQLELLSWTNNLRPDSKICLIHGERNSKMALKELLEKEKFSKVLTPQRGDTIKL